MLPRSRFLAVIGLLTAPAPALSCSIILPADYDGSAKQLRDVRAAITSSPVIVDGEVMRAYEGKGNNALIRVHHVLKGNPPQTVEVGVADSCSIELDRIGERSRMILSGGPEVFQLYRDQSEARLEDRILKSDRRKVWPFVAGRPSVQNKESAE